MKNIFIAVTIISIIVNSCTTLRVPVNTPEINTKVKDDRVSEMLLGHCSRACLLESPYKEWFVKNYGDYSVDSNTANKLVPLLKNKTIVIFMGTWCGDSRREVPRLIKILDFCKQPDDALKLVMVDYRDGTYKQSPQHEEKGLNIFRVPTILIYQGKKEIGRIIEFPRETLEKDLLLLLAGEEYTPNYSAGYHYMQKLNNRKLNEWLTDSLTLVSSLHSTLRNNFELNSIAHVFLDNGQKEEALFSYRLNTQLYPSLIQTWNALAAAHLLLNRRDEAWRSIEMALQLDPNNEETKKLETQLMAVQK